jgi:hypothetical protein
MGTGDIEQTKDQIANHLQFLGYDVVKEEKIIRAKHPKKPNMAARVFSDGVLHTSYWGTNDYAKRNRQGLLEYLNGLNLGASVARYYVDKDNDLVIESWYMGGYERTNYGRFLELCDGDFEKFLKVAETESYLK